MFLPAGAEAQRDEFPSAPGRSLSVEGWVSAEGLGAGTARGQGPRSRRRRPAKAWRPRERRSGRLRVVTTGSSLLEPGVCVCVCVCECVSMHTCAHLCLGVGRGRAGGEEGKKTQRKGHQELCKVLEHGSRLARRVWTDLHQTAPCFPAAPVTHVLGSRNPRNACFLPCLPHYTSTWPWSHLAPWFNGYPSYRRKTTSRRPQGQSSIHQPSYASGDPVWPRGGQRSWPQRGCLS